MFRLDTSEVKFWLGSWPRPPIMGLGRNLDTVQKISDLEEAAFQNARPVSGSS